MSEETTKPVIEKVLTLAEATATFKDMSVEALQQKYADEFGELPMVGETGELSTDVALITKKLAYSLILSQANDKGLAVSPRTKSYAEKAFAIAFEAKKEGGVSRTGGNTIQKFLVDRMAQAVRDKEPLTKAQLAAEVIAAFPGSTYVNNPIGRVTADINKYNKGMFVYAQVNDLIPAGVEQYFVPAPEAPKAPVEAEAVASE